MWLPWEFGAVVAAVCALSAYLLGGRSFRTGPARSPTGGDRTRAVLARVARELSVMFALYAVWRLLNRVDPPTVDLEDARARGRTLWRIERAVGLGSERWLQEQTLRSSSLTQFANGYYALAHLPVTIAWLAWMFFRHPTAYVPWRRLLAWFTVAGVAVRLVAVAPPRLVTDLGIIDTPARFDQSVYGPLGSGVSDQLAAMPSIHVGWAVLVAASCVRLGGRRARALGVAHLVFTALAVVVTGNHWWLDGIAAAAMIAAAHALLDAVARRAPVADPIAGGPGGRGAPGRASRDH
jgi:hypothetical protein